MLFSHVTINVKNMEESLAFYRDIIGLPIKRRFAIPNGEIAFLGDDERTEVELIHGLNSAPQFGTDISLGFAVEACDEAVALFASHGIAPEGELMPLGPQLRCFFVRDPDGLRVQILGK